VASSGEIRYARSDSFNIAFQLLGGEGRDLLAFPSAVLLPIDAMDDEPALARFHRRLASFSRLIRFDPRGVGFSDPLVPTGPATLEQWVQDAPAVMDAAGSENAAIFAPVDSSLTAVVMATSHPERVHSLVLVNGTARMARDSDYPVGIPQQVLDRFIEVNFEPDAVGRGFDFLRLAAPSVADDDAFRAWWTKAGYRGASPAAARALQAASLSADVRSVLPLVRVPTLIMHRRGNAIVRAGHGRYLAEHIPGSKYIELGGDDHLYWVGDTTVMLDEIEEFLTGSRGTPNADRVLTTILFTDIVGSTEQAAGAGDRRWRDLLDAHDRMVARQVHRFGGRQVKSIGDGILATFDGPARAIQCGLALRDGARQLGLDARVGLHTGEVERRAEITAPFRAGPGARWTFLVLGPTDQPGLAPGPASHPAPHPVELGSPGGRIMSDGLCLLVDVLDDDEALAHTAAHLTAAPEAAGDDLVFANVLAGVGGGPDVALVGIHDPGAADRLADASPLPTDPPWCPTSRIRRAAAAAEPGVDRSDG
jgi:pimeloyl-ACP methyl ester carboxylesterase